MLSKKIAQTELDFTIALPLYDEFGTPLLRTFSDSGELCGSRGYLEYDFYLYICCLTANIRL
jgi:hypothetical protein